MPSATVSLSALSTVSGGHASAHLSTHTLSLSGSGVNQYSVIPSLPTRKVPRASVLPRLTVAAEVWAKTGLATNKETSTMNKFLSLNILLPILFLIKIMIRYPGEGGASLNKSNRSDQRVWIAFLTQMQS